ncbi:hypothetical protein BV98_002212 [Sphingobium herbicidovorans NBRC 16415]|uniref:Uncharacterized protein n=1 Tax=Sphingobium herbicidovorans (strain ATCC 700291 / DSM 11019 / CCUG 56400 / KCTC 2939 / LMG 18315 / NBRC 16415 / MH) TaxID=1219045 RepID=A0A086P9H1_SPHHM|nr:hypothetical protein [Sphingobium herbicidovorans]KFG90039.1 hypothetical protein BV98_002212 [Sphingobium herbicidovorans NBRC 16415]
MRDRQIDLGEEMMHAAASAGKHLDRLMAWGIAKETIASLGAYAPIGLAKVERLSNLMYQPNDDGEPHLILPVHEGGDIIDMVAFDPRWPDRWLRRTGNAVLLNADDIAAPRWDAGTVEVWATPLDWLRAGGEGVVILDYDNREVVEQLKLCETIVTDRVTARLIRLEFSRPQPVPNIVNRERRRHVA